MHAQTTTRSIRESLQVIQSAEEESRDPQPKVLREVRKINMLLARLEAQIEPDA